MATHFECIVSSRFLFHFPELQGLFLRDRQMNPIFTAYLSTFYATEFELLLCIHFLKFFFILSHYQSCPPCVCAFDLLYLFYRFPFTIKMNSTQRVNLARILWNNFGTVYDPERIQCQTVDLNYSTILYPLDFCVDRIVILNVPCFFSQNQFTHLRFNQRTRFA